MPVSVTPVVLQGSGCAFGELSRARGWSFGWSLSRMVQGARGSASVLCPARGCMGGTSRNPSQGRALGSRGVPGERWGHTGCATSC